MLLNLTGFGSANLLSAVKDLSIEAHWIRVPDHWKFWLSLRSKDPLIKQFKLFAFHLMMASLKEQTKDLTTCSICLETFNEGRLKPKFLSCAHTFCLKCTKVITHKPAVE